MRRSWEQGQGSCSGALPTGGLPQGQGSGKLEMREIAEGPGALPKQGSSLQKLQREAESRVTLQGFLSLHRVPGSKLADAVCRASGRGESLQGALRFP